ncbi:MAG: hypothetical protein ACRD28_12715 [Acidobacteriaceae bacterium]
MTLLSVVWATVGLTMPSLLLAKANQPRSASKWTLPRDTTIRNTARRTYRFTVVYYTANKTGQITHRQRVTGDYILGLPHNQVEWNDVTVAEANGDTAPFSAPQKRGFMDGFHYRENADTFSPDFFRSFPPSATVERNLVWDTDMFKMFGQKYLDRLKLNQPLHIISDKDVKMPDLGTFRNRNVVLEWVGRSRRNGQDCALIDYRAFFNPLHIANGGMTLIGRSDYWGEIWVSLATRQIEYSTLHEEVTGEMKLSKQTALQPISIFRIGSFRRLSTSH